MFITRKSMVSGKLRTLDLPITIDQVIEYEDGALIQDAFPNLTDSQREFILTGITDDEWNKTFPEDEEEPEDEPAF
jgi:hypothetical protein